MLYTYVHNLFLSVVELYEFFRLTKLIEDVMDVVNSNMDRKLLLDLIRDGKIVSTMTGKILNGTTKGRFFDCLSIVEM